jgi:hypothetical protein
MREMEEFKWKIIGAAAVVGAVTSIGTSFLL